MSTHTILRNVLQSSSGEGLTLREIVSDLPSDPASLFTIVLFVGAVVFVLWAGRSGGQGGKPA